MKFRDEVMLSIVCICIVSALCLITTMEVKLLADKGVSDNTVLCGEPIPEDDPIWTCYDEEEVVETVDVIPSISFVNHKGRTIHTDVITVDTNALYEIYECSSESPEWDIKNQISTIEVLWEFLTVQQDVSPKNAASIIGAVSWEGHFSEHQGANVYIESIEEARELLGSGKKGYGIAQWTYSTRQKALLEYYELAYELYPDDWDKVRILAECSMLIEELKGYDVFEDIYNDTTIEDATGRMCIIFEGYAGCENQWSEDNGVYYLSSTKGSGNGRLQYAYNVYDYFMNE